MSRVWIIGGSGLIGRALVGIPGDQAIAPFVHYSTDYVCAGAGISPWREDDATEPANAYGRTKLEGDRLVEASGARYLILRTSWVYDAHGRNFVNTTLSLGRDREVLRVVSDQVRAPSLRLAWPS